MGRYLRTLTRPLAQNALRSFHDMPAGYSLRLARLEDLDAILDIAAACFPTDLPTRHGVRHYLTRAHAAIFMIEDKNGNIAGYHHVEANASNKILYLNTVALLPPHRGKGIGKALYGFQELLALRGRFSGVRFHVSDDNPASLKLAQSCGYKTIKIEKAYLEDGSDSYLMEKKVGKS